MIGRRMATRAFHVMSDFHLTRALYMSTVLAAAFAGGAAFAADAPIRVYIGTYTGPKSKGDRKSTRLNSSH